MSKISCPLSNDQVNHFVLEFFLEACCFGHFAVIILILRTLLNYNKTFFYLSRSSPSNFKSLFLEVKFSRKLYIIE